MNIFRLIADLLHVLAIIILLFKICKTRSCAGISGKSQILFAIVFTTRYLDLLTTYISAYNTILKILYIVTSYATVFLIYIKFKKTYEYNYDTLRIEFLLLSSLALALLFNHEFSAVEVLWAFSIYLESVAILPQLFLVWKTGKVERITSYYLFAMGSYRGLYLLNWLYRYYAEDHYDLISIFAGLVQTFLYLGFIIPYSRNADSWHGQKIHPITGGEQAFRDSQPDRQNGFQSGRCVGKDGVLSFEDGIALVHGRGKGTQQASNLMPQGMLSIPITHKSKVSEACRVAEKWAMDSGIEKPVNRGANYQCTENKILAGNNEALEYIEKKKKQFGLGSVKRLPVSETFHTLLMEPSLNYVSRMIDTLTMDQQSCKIYSNYKAEPYKNSRVKKYICKQIVSPVEWEQCIQPICNRPQDMQFPMTNDIEERMKLILKFIKEKTSRECTVI